MYWGLTCYLPNSGSNFLFDDDSSDDEAKVTIGNIRKNTPYQKQSMSGKNKIDMDGQPTINGNMIYDLDLATMEDKPWQKPGADITDYFNYGFNEGLFYIVRVLGISLFRNLELLLRASA